jgi:AcrR family transcriptional regulator
MTQSSRSSTPKSPLRRQPKQQRSKDRVEAILTAAADLFDSQGYEATTTHQIATASGTAIGSLYQFFPDKAAIFNAMELRHVDRVHSMWASTDIEAIAHLPLRTMVHLLVLSVQDLLSDPISRVVFTQFFIARHLFQSIDDRMTQDAIAFMAHILQARNPHLLAAKLHLLADVCVQSSNALILSLLRSNDLEYRKAMTQEIEDIIVAYLSPHMPDDAEVMKVMICPHCRSTSLSRNGHRRGQQCYCCKDCGKQFVESKLSFG